ncbi:MAG TPA: thioredoxin fold domain-containing protein [Burkholderiales bacterium]|nr:thioredoxin fold domain-containing protein [Burkholderiales bacterium]
MARVLRSLLAVLAALMLAAPGMAGAQTGAGKLKGGVAYTLPNWFKPSFLDFRQDVAEARKQNRHVMVFVHLDDCPYCARMLKESFVSGDNHDFIRRHFDVIAVNVRGSLEVQWIDGVSYTERGLTMHLKVVGTPTLLFLGEDGGIALRLNGYRDPRALRAALEYVQSRSYRSQPFAAYLATRDHPAVYAFRDHPQFAAATNFKGYRKPLAVLFEDRRCAECARFHEKTLSHPDVVAEMKQYLFVRLDAGSNQPLVDLAGNATTPAQWAKALNLTYRPAVVLFNEGREILRVDTHLYHFHFKEALRYVSGGHYQRYETLSRYNAARRTELLKQGIDIDYGE